MLNDFVGASLWEAVARALQVSRLARANRVVNDEFRTPRVALLLGADGWVTHKDNEIL